MSASAGKRLGRYEIRSLLGVGGMGEVYLAQDTQLLRPVALKLLPSEFSLNQERLNRFKQEAFAASALNHPNILTIYEVGSEGDVHFIATEFIEGLSLRERMVKEPLTVEQVLDIGGQIAAALAAAHAKGIVHRDVKPENVMVRHDGYVKVLDFGVAKLLDRAAAADESRNATVATAMVGTVRYMSPEQLRGDEVDARTDVWGLAVVLYELLTDSLPFPGRTPPDVIAAILRLPPLPPSEVAPGRVPPELDAVIARALAKDRGARQAGCDELAAELDALQVTLLAKESAAGKVRAA